MIAYFAATTTWSLSNSREKHPDAYINMYLYFIRVRLFEKCSVSSIYWTFNEHTSQFIEHTSQDSTIDITRFWTYTSQDIKSSSQDIEHNIHHQDYWIYITRYLTCLQDNNFKIHLQILNIHHKISECTSQNFRINNFLHVIILAILNKNLRSPEKEVECLRNQKTKR